MKIIFSIIVSFSLFSAISDAQVIIRPLKVGDTIPDVTINQILHYKSPTAKISDFKGKLLVIDFWATYCIPCIQELPRFDSLQKQFTGRIQILPVTFQNKEIISSFIKRIPSLKNINLPFVVSDSLLYGLFPHMSIPHDIILDKNGVVKAVLNSTNVNSQTIENILDEKDVGVTSKGENDNFNFDFEAPFFLDSIGKKILLVHQMLTSHYDDISVTRSGRRQHEGQQIDYRIMGTNMRLLNMYRVALLKKLAGPSEIPDIRISLHVKDMQKFRPPENLSVNSKLIWEKKNTYCYDFMIPDSSGIDVYSLFKENLDRYFRVNSKTEVKLVDCFIIKSIDSAKYKSKGKEPILDLGKDLWTICNHSFYEVFRRLTPNLDYNIVDETNFSGKVDLVLRPVFNNPETLKADLKRQGLDLIKGKREMEFITIEDR